MTHPVAKSKQKLSSRPGGVCVELVLALSLLSLLAISGASAAPPADGEIAVPVQIAYFPRFITPDSGLKSSDERGLERSDPSYLMSLEVDELAKRLTHTSSARRSEAERQLYAYVRPLPARERRRNWEAYRRLAVLNPNLSLYQQKAAHYRPSEGTTKTFVATAALYYSPQQRASIESGSIDGVRYQINHGDLTATLSNSAGERLWTITCGRYATVSCTARTHALALTVTTTRAIKVEVGERHLRGSEVTVQLDSQVPFVASAERQFSPSQSRAILARLSTATRVQTVYRGAEGFPQRESWNLEGVNTMKRYLDFALERLAQR